MKKVTHAAVTKAFAAVEADMSIFEREGRTSITTFETNWDARERLEIILNQVRDALEGKGYDVSWVACRTLGNYVELDWAYAYTNHNSRELSMMNAD